jgi:selenocysteine lyase/cysteine desulfurase
MSVDHSAMVEARNRLRALMPVTKKWTYFDHAAMAPLPMPAGDVLRKWIDEAVNEGTPKWPEWVAQVERMRADAARMIGADADEIALVRNTTCGISLVAEGLSWKPGDNVVTLADEFPSNMFPWLQLADRGVETRRVPTENGRLNLDDLAAACDARTRLVSVSWVGYATGYRHDIERIVEIAHSRGALMFLDAIQGLGAF